MKNKGKDQGNMSPTVEDYQRPESTYPERQAGKTTEYISRQNARQKDMAKEVEKQHYKGRYS